MAIEQDRLSVASLATLTKVEFETEGELQENTEVVGTASDSSSPLDPPVVKPPVKASDSSVGIVDVPGNSKYQSGTNMSKLVKVKKATTSNSRDLVTKKGVNIDAHLVVDTKPATGHTILTGDIEIRLDKVLSIELENIRKSGFGKNILTMAKHIKTMLVSKINNTIGATLKDKLLIDKVINTCKLANYGTAIDTKASISASIDFTYNIGDIKLLSVVVNATFLDTIACAGINKAIGIVMDMVGKGTVNRSILLRALKESVTKDNDTNADNKLLLIKAIVDSAENDEERKLLLIHTKGMAGNILRNLSVSVNGTKSKVSDYHNLTESLNIADPSWNKDVDNEVNYTEASKCEKLVTVSEAKNEYKHPEETTDGIVATNLDASLTISILAKFS